MSKASNGIVPVKKLMKTEAYEKNAIINHQGHAYLVLSCEKFGRSFQLSVKRFFVDSNPIERIFIVEEPYFVMEPVGVEG